MKATLLATLLLTCGFDALAADGNQLLAGCTAVIQTAEGGGKDFSDKKIMDASICLGMMEGITQTLVMSKLLSKEDGSKDQFGTCLPSNGITNGQAARVVVRYLNQNPDKLHMPAPILSLFAFKTSFACE